MMGISFLSPWRLLLLFVVVALGITYALFQKRRSKYAVRFTNLELLESIAPNRPGWRRHIAAAVQLVALAALVLAFAQPVHDVKVPRERATVMLALDVSLSMEATDVKPDRIEAAKVAATAFLDDVPAQFNVGLVTFAGSAKIRVAPTTDRQQVANAIQNAQLDDGTAIGDAIDASLDALEDVPYLQQSCCCPMAPQRWERRTPLRHNVRSTKVFPFQRLLSARRPELSRCPMARSSVCLSMHPRLRPSQSSLGATFTRHPRRTS